MAFNINNKTRLPSEPEVETSVTNVANTVASENWVSNLIKGLEIALANSISTICLKVSENLQANVIGANQVAAKSFSLVDESGKTMTFTLEGGKLVSSYNYEDVYLKTSDNYKVYVLDEKKNKFVPFVTKDFVMNNGNKCYKICETSGNSEKIPYVMLITCPDDKVITGLKVLDKEGVSLFDIEIPEPSNKLTINLERGIDLPSVDEFDDGQSSCCDHHHTHAHCHCVCPTPDLFDDEFESDSDKLCDCLFRGVNSDDDDVAIEYDSTTSDVIIGEEGDDDNYVGDGFVNIELNASQFEVDKMQFVYVETRDA